MKCVLRSALCAVMLVLAASAQQPLQAPDKVFIVTGAQATALYHRQGCAWLRSGAPTALTLEEARKRYFQPHCQCIAGKEGAPPCEPATAPDGASAATAAEAATTMATSAATATLAAKSTSVPSNATETVYVTRTGAKYHRAGCRSLSRSQIPMTLKEASARYGPCSICRPPVLSAAPPTTTTTPAAAAQAEGATRPPPSRAPASSRCQAMTKKGTQCSRTARAGSSYCWQHGG